MQKTIASFTLALTLGLAVCLVFVQPFPVLHDLPEWMYQSWIFHHLIAGTSPEISQQYVLVDYPVPNSLSQIVMGGLNFFVSPVVAGRIWLCIYLALAAALWQHLYRRQADAWQQLLLTCIITFGPGFWNGYINFQFALLLFALFLLLDARKNTRSIWMLVLFSVLLFFSHAAVYLVFGVFVFLQIVFDRSITMQRKVSGVVSLLPSGLLLCWYSIELIGLHARQSDSGMGLSKWLQYKFYTLGKQGPFHNFILHNGESQLENLDLIYKAGFVANFLFAALLGVWLLAILWNLTRGKLQESLRQPQPLLPLVLTLVVCFLVYLLTGSNTLGVVNLGERFLIAALMLVLLFFKCPLILQRMLGGVAIVFMLYVLAATILLSGGKMQQYAVARSADTSDIVTFVDDIYASSRHQYFNHRLFIYADRGLQLQKPNPAILPIDLPTSVVQFR